MTARGTGNAASGFAADPLHRPYCLPPGTSLIPVTALAGDVRAALQCPDSSVVITCHQSRSASRLLGAQAAALVRLFREPRTIADAIAQRVSETGADVTRYSDAALPILFGLVDADLLVSGAKSPGTHVDRPLGPGARVGSYRIVECIRSLPDSDIYHARHHRRGHVALKLTGLTPHSDDPFERERRALEHLHGLAVVPAILDAGRISGRPFIATEWIAGDDVGAAATERRQMSPGKREIALRDLAVAVLDAFVRIHATGILHGDIHPRNVLVRDDGSIVVIDFGAAVGQGIGQLGSRPGVLYFVEPELAANPPHERPLPPSAAGEQFALAALAYLLFTGDTYVNFAATEAAARRQICEDAMVPFVARGVPAWPEVERAIARALSKHPRDRFASVDDFAKALRAAPLPRRIRPRPHLVTVRQTLIRTLAAAIQCDDTSQWKAAEIGTGALHLAVSLDDAMLLAWADAWASHATGCHVLHAQVARARADSRALGSAARAYVRGARGVDAAARSLLECCTMYRSASMLPARWIARFVERGNWISSRLTAAASSDFALPLAASLRWARVTGTRVPAAAPDWFRSMSDGADAIESAAGGCVHACIEVMACRHLSALAQRARETAEQSLRAAHEQQDVPSALEHAHAALRLYRHTGAAEWLDTAASIAKRAFARTNFDAPNALTMSGALGVIVLCTHVERPERARAPEFEDFAP